MTAVGTPLFAAPEVLRGDKYSESVDCYSYGMVLLAMSVDGPLLEYVTWRFYQDFGTKHVPWAKIIRRVSESGWRAAPYELAPPQVNTLIRQCCAEDPSMRPSFADIVHLLVTEAADEVNLSCYPRFRCSHVSSFNREDVSTGLSDSFRPPDGCVGSIALEEHKEETSDSFAPADHDPAPQHSQTHRHLHQLHHHHYHHHHHHHHHTADSTFGSRI